MRQIWRGLKFVGRWLGPVLLALAAALFLFPTGAWGDYSAIPALAGAVVCAIACLAMRVSERQKQRRILAAAAMLGLLFYGLHSWQDGRGYSEQTVAFDNQGAHLVGTLYLPDRVGKSPGMVLLGGSGATPRAFYRPIGATFARKGFAVLVYDKRGVGDSTGEREARFFTDVPRDLEPLASDAAAGAAFLARRPEVRPEAGISEGGVIAPRAAVLNGRIAYILSISSTPTSLYAIVKHQGGEQGLEVAKRWFRRDFDPMPSLRAIDIPSLWVMAGEETLVSNEVSAVMLDDLRNEGKPIEHRLIPGAWHGLVIGPPRLMWQVMDPWLAQVTALRMAGRNK